MSGWIVNAKGQQKIPWPYKAGMIDSEFGVKDFAKMNSKQATLDKLRSETFLKIIYGSLSTDARFQLCWMFSTY